MLNLIKRIKGLRELYIRKFKDYWLGSVYVGKHYIYGDWPEEKRLYTVSIIPSFHGKGAWFSDIEASKIKNLVKSLSVQKPKYVLHLDYGCGAFLEYMFNRYQQAILLTELTEILNSEVMYYEE